MPSSVMVSPGAQRVAIPKSMSEMFASRESLSKTKLSSLRSRARCPGCGSAPLRLAFPHEQRDCAAVTHRLRM